MCALDRDALKGREPIEPARRFRGDGWASDEHDQLISHLMRVLGHGERIDQGLREQTCLKWLACNVTRQ